MTSHIELSVATYNIHKSVGGDRRRDPARTAAVIAEIGADIVALQEADMRFGSRAGLLDMEALRRDLGLILVPVEETIGAAHGHHGNLILVRNALVEVVHHLDLPGLEPRGALMTDLVIKGQPIRVIAAHFGLLPGSRLRQSKALLAKLHTLDTRPTLLMGDLNEWRVGERSSLGPLTSHFYGPLAVRSFPARYPLVPLDRIMACPQGELTEVVAHRTALSRIASDHLPIRARLRLRRSGIAAQPAQAS
jgi:endonuclease/exonuclease/phosphatase family metal-dependent hydrolase